jgi:hypothetical protein
MLTIAGQWARWRYVTNVLAQRDAEWMWYNQRP